MADDVSRGIAIHELNERWQHGPEFLRLPREDWPQDVSEVDDKEVSKEARKIVCTVKTSENCNTIEPKKHSSWRKLIRVTGYVLKFVRKIRKKKTDETSEQLVNPDPKYLSAQQLNEAETYLIKDAQKDLHNRIKKEELTTLSPFTDSEGVIRVGGRADKATVSYESKHPALLPYASWISLLITRQSHSFGHNGVATTAAKV